MSYEHGPAAPPPSPPPTGPQPPPTPADARRKRTLRILGVVAIAVAAWGIGLGMGVASQDDDDTSTTSGTSARSNEPNESDRSQAPATTTTTAPYVPQPADFTINIITLEKSCFGSAGCNVTYTVELAYNAIQPLDPSETYQVIYDITGGEQVQTETIEVTGTSYSYNEQSFISTLNEASVLAATVTMVRPT